MADTKISAMTAATFVLNADVVPIVQGGVNLKSSRALFLTGSATEDIQLKGASGQKAQIVPDDGNALIETLDGGLVNIRALTTLDVFSSDGVTTGEVIWDPTGVFVVTDGSGGIWLGDPGFAVGMTLDPVGGNFILTGFTSYLFDYIAGTPTDWSGAAPTDLFTAIDRCATLLKTLNGGAGP